MRGGGHDGHLRHWFGRGRGRQLQPHIRLIGGVANRSIGVARRCGVKSREAFWSVTDRRGRMRHPADYCTKKIHNLKRRSIAIRRMTKSDVLANRIGGPRIERHRAKGLILFPCPSLSSSRDTPIRLLCAACPVTCSVIALTNGILDLSLTTLMPGPYTAYEVVRVLELSRFLWEETTRWSFLFGWRTKLYRFLQQTAHLLLNLVHRPTLDP